MDAACFVIDLIAKFSCTQSLCLVRIACIWPTTSIMGAARGGYKTAVWLALGNAAGTTTRARNMWWWQSDGANVQPDPG
jgi:hypothetical protein